MILLRHGQSEFNVRFSVNKHDPGIPDPPLTAAGLDQARAAAEALAGGCIRRIVTSPYTRALQTAAVLAGRFHGAEVVVNPIVRERSAFSCDIGTPASALARAWPTFRFGGLDEIWWPAAEETVEAAGARAARFRAETAALPDWHEVLVVSHWGFILALTGVRLQNGEWLRHDPTAPAPEGGAYSLDGPYLLK